MNGLTNIPGILVGHASDYDGLTGTTVILCETGAVAGCDIRGSASGTQEFDVMSPLHVTDRVHAVVFSGGSAFGLEAASGVRRFLAQKGIGFPTGAAPVPIVPSAILFDLSIGKATARPTREMGETAAAAATSKPVVEGAIGAGTGATVGKMLGMKNAMKSGIGSGFVTLEGQFANVVVAALAAVNAVGDVIDPSGKIVAGTRTAPDSREFANSARLMKGGAASPLRRENTTLICVATNAALTKVQAQKLAQLANLGVARAINPVNTMADGDVAIALSIGKLSAPIDAIGVAAAEAVAQAIVRAVEQSSTYGGVPGLKK